MAVVTAAVVAEVEMAAVEMVGVGREVEMAVVRGVEWEGVREVVKAVAKEAG